MTDREVRFEATAQGHLMMQELTRLGAVVLSTNRWVEGERALGVVVTGLKLRMPTEERPDCLVIVSALKGDRVLVGFHSADMPAEAIRGAIARVENGTMVWRNDLYSGQDEET